MEQKLTNLLTESIEILYEKDQHLIDLGGMEQGSREQFSRFGF